MRTTFNPRRQLSFFPNFKKTGACLKEFGGGLRPEKRKVARPFHPKLALHLVLKSSNAVGALSLLHPGHCKRVNVLITETAKKYRVRLFRFSNSGNHLHLLAKFPDRITLRGFLRELAGQIARLITRAKKTQPERFWSELPYSRIVDEGRSFLNTDSYVIRNQIEAELVLKRDLSAKMFRFGRWGPAIH